MPLSNPQSRPDPPTRTRPSPFKGWKDIHAGVRRFAEGRSAFGLFVEGGQRVVVIAAVADGAECGVCGDGVTLVEALLRGVEIRLMVLGSW